MRQFNFAEIPSIRSGGSVFSKLDFDAIGAATESTSRSNNKIYCLQSCDGRWTNGKCEKIIMENEHDEDRRTQEEKK